MLKSIAIVGAGHAGVQVAATLRSEGYDGRLTLISSEAHLPYHRPPLSKVFLAEEAATIRPLRPESFYRQNQIQLLLGISATSIDRRARQLGLADGRTLGYDALVLATGARARVPDLPGCDLPNVHYLRTASDAAHLKRALLLPRRRLVVLGGGFIGLEVAATAAELGCPVTVIEARPRLLQRVVSPRISDYFYELHTGLKTKVHLSAQVERLVDKGGGETAVVLASGEEIAADIVLVGVGSVPDTALASRAGLVVGEGVLVDPYLIASNEIYAVGDVARLTVEPGAAGVRLESVQNAVDQAAAAARNILGASMPYASVPWFWSDQSMTRLQIAGDISRASWSVLRGRTDDDGFSIFHFAGERLVGAESINRASDHIAARRILDAEYLTSADDLANLSFDLRALSRALGRDPLSERRTS